MRRLTPAAACLLLLAGHAAITAQAPPAPPAPPPAPYVKLPATKAARPGRYFCLKVDSNCKSIRWLIPAGLEQLDPEIPVKDAPFAVVLIGDAGTYTVSAYGALGDVATDVASCVVTIGTPPPPAPPVPPAPTDPFAAALQAAYATETAPAKAAVAAAWATVYSEAAGMLGTANTVADLLSDINAARAATSPGQLPAVDKVIAAELTAAFGTDGSKPLDRAAAKAELAKIAAALGALK